MDFADMTDAQVDAELGNLYAESQRRAALRAAPAVMEQAAAEWRAAAGRLDGDPYVEPTGYHDAYAFDALVTYKGKQYRATRDGAVGIPGQSPDWWQVSIGQPTAWVQPYAGTEYLVGAEVIHKGRLWRNDHTASNGWAPGAVGSKWTDIGPA